MNVDAVLTALNNRGVEYLLVGGMNFLLRHKPVLTFDIDIWIRDTDANCNLCEQALSDMKAQWGATEAEWGAVSLLSPGWLRRQSMFCLTTAYGALDVFRTLPGPDSWGKAVAASVECRTHNNTTCRGLNDLDMLRCQEALDESDRKMDRVAYLKRILQKGARTRE